MSNFFNNRLYSLGIDNFFNYSFFYFYVFTINKEYYRVYKLTNINISYLYEFVNKKGQIYLFYNILKTESFCLPKIISIFYKNTDILSLPNIFFNTNFYNINNYKNISLKKTFNNWIIFFNMSKIIDYNIIYNKILNMNFTNLSFSKNRLYVFIFNNRNNIIKYLV